MTTPPPPYTIAEIRDTSTGAVHRRSASVVLAAEDRARAREVLLEVAKIAARPGIEALDSYDRLHRSTFQAAIVHVFLWHDAERVGSEMAIARAVFVGKGTPKANVPMRLPKGERVNVAGGFVALDCPQAK